MQVWLLCCVFEFLFFSLVFYGLILWLNSIVVSQCCGGKIVLSLLELTSFPVSTDGFVQWSRRSMLNVLKSLNFHFPLVSPVLPSTWKFLQPGVCGELLWLFHFRDLCVTHLAVLHFCQWTRSWVSRSASFPIYFSTEFDIFTGNVTMHFHSPSLTPRLLVLIVSSSLNTISLSLTEFGVLEKCTGQESQETCTLLIQSSINFSGIKVCHLFCPFKNFLSLW